MKRAFVAVILLAGCLGCLGCGRPHFNAEYRAIMEQRIAELEVAAEKQQACCETCAAHAVFLHDLLEGTVTDGKK